MQKIVDTKPELKTKIARAMPTGVKTLSQRGRKPGACSVTDSQLIEKLEKVSRESSRVHSLLKCPIRTLEQSKRRLAAAKVTGLQRSQLAKRLAICRLPFSAHTTQRGRCDACEAWNLGGKKKVEHIYAEGFRLLECMLPGYFLEWKRQVEADHLDTRELERTDNPEYAERFIAFVQGHEAGNEPSRDHLLPEDRVRMSAMEIELTESVTAELEDIRNIFWHWSMRTTLDQLWRECWYTPRECTLYGLWDHMATHFFKSFLD